MGLAPEVSLVVKHTFLEWIRTDVPRRPRSRSLTDTDLLKGVSLETCEPMDDFDTTDDRAPITASPALRPDAAPSGYPSPSLDAFPMTPFLECMLDTSAEGDFKLGLPPSAMDGLDGVAFYTPYFDQLPYGCGWAYLPFEDGYGDCDAWANMAGTWEQDFSSVEFESPGTPPSDDGRASDMIIPFEDATVEAAVCTNEEMRTTVMLRDVPTRVSRDMLTQVLDQLGFCGLYDMVYVPVDFSSGSGLGYAFVNMVSPRDVPSIWAALDGFSQWGLDDANGACTIRWAEPNQGLLAHVERYRNSPVMHPEVPDEWKPALFAQGVRVSFPPPTKKLKSPKVRVKKAAVAPNE